MNIWFLRFSITALLIWAFLINKTLIPPYLLALMALFEFLNYRDEFKSNPNYRIINLISFVFIFIIFLNRIRLRHFNLEFEVPVNILEHLMFSFVICIAIWEILKMNFIVPLKLGHRLLIINLVFFIVGITNEIYQYYAFSYTHNALHLFILDSIKDIIVNCSGGLLFSIIIAALNRTELPFVNQFIIEE